MAHLTAPALQAPAPSPVSPNFPYLAHLTAPALQAPVPSPVSPGVPLTFLNDLWPTLMTETNTQTVNVSTVRVDCKVGPCVR